MKYKKAKAAILCSVKPDVTIVSENQLLGMLYVVDVRVSPKSTREIIKHRLLMVGCEQSDIERKLRWVFDSAQFAEMSVTKIEKVREKVHFLQTTITQPNEANGAPTVKSADGSAQVIQPFSPLIEKYDPKLFAVGITTTMLAKDRDHALRKVGHAIVTASTVGHSHTGASLSEDSTVTVEEIAFSSGYAMPRDVSAEVNRAHVMRG